MYASWKQMLGINKKPSFLLKKNLPIQPMISSGSKNFNHPCWNGVFPLFHLFEVVSGTFQLLLACYGFFCVVSFFREWFDLQIYYESTSCRFYYKGLQASS